MLLGERTQEYSSLTCEKKQDWRKVCTTSTWKRSLKQAQDAHTHHAQRNIQKICFQKYLHNQLRQIYIFVIIVLRS